jgi:hypothetical protein
MRASTLILPLTIFLCFFGVCVSVNDSISYGMADCKRVCTNNAIAYTNPQARHATIQKKTTLSIFLCDDLIVQVMSYLPLSAVFILHSIFKVNRTKKQQLLSLVISRKLDQMPSIYRLIAHDLYSLNHWERVHQMSTHDPACLKPALQCIICSMDVKEDIVCKVTQVRLCHTCLVDARQAHNVISTPSTLTGIRMVFGYSTLCMPWDLITDITRELRVNRKQMILPDCVFSRLMLYSRTNTSLLVTKRRFIRINTNTFMRKSSYDRYYGKKRLLARVQTCLNWVNETTTRSMWNQRFELCVSSLSPVVLHLKQYTRLAVTHRNIKCAYDFPNVLYDLMMKANLQYVWLFDIQHKNKT